VREVLADARCLEHPRRSLGVVVRASDGSPSWESRHRGRPSVSPVAFDPHDNTLFVKLRETTDVEVEGWCRDCRKARRVKIADLLDAATMNHRGIVLA
jgi:hypothetical protein